MPEHRVEIEFSDEALADFAEVTDWYLSQLAFDAASGLADEVGAALIYRLGSGRLRVIAVSHHSRRPGFWKKRR